VGTLAQVEQRPPVTILVSIDGFRPDYLDRGMTPILDAVAAAGVRGTLRPSFPALTFPNHYSLVTGLHPDRHGVVDNNMEDPARPGVRFATGDYKVARDPFWWDGAEPLWVTAERAGIRTGTMFWPGSDAAIRGVRPSVWVPYEAAITSEQRVGFILDWLRRPAAERPQLLTLYFDVVDKTAHNQGFDSPEKFAAIREVDTAIGHLRAGLAALGQPANLVIVSDHGMAPVPADNLIDIRPIIDPHTMRVAFGGPMLGIFTGAKDDAAVAAQLLRARPHMRCLRRGALPVRFRYGRHPRVPPFLCLADLGWRFTTELDRRFVKGEHGYDPADPSMHALFVAEGPALRTGVRTRQAELVDVYPLLRRLAGLPPVAGLDSSDTLVGAALKR
jgi:predicted AlkP superfamily pyrophosphatase or phosphodiesterase